MELKNIYAAFVKAQASFAPALKTNTNPHFKSKYADLATCIEAVIDSLHTNGIALVQKTQQDDKGVTVETVFIHESGESMTGGPLHVPAAKMDPQGFGSALSYARRYSLMTACGIAPEDDDGEAASKAKAAQLRAAWIADRKQAINGAMNSGEMKRVLADAIAATDRENDSDAADQLRACAAAKVATAKAQGATV